METIAQNLILVLRTPERFFSFLLEMSQSIDELKQLLKPEEYALIADQVPRRAEALEKKKLLSDIRRTKTIDQLAAILEPFIVAEASHPLPPEWLFDLEDVLLNKYEQFCQAKLKDYRARMLTTSLANREMTLEDIELQQDVHLPEDHTGLGVYQDTYFGERLYEQAYQEIFSPLEYFRQNVLEKLPVLGANQRFAVRLQIIELNTRHTALGGKVTGGKPSVE